MEEWENRVREWGCVYKSAVSLCLPWCEGQRATSGVSLQGLLFVTVQVRLPDPRPRGIFSLHLPSPQRRTGATDKLYRDYLFKCLPEI